MAIAEAHLAARYNRPGHEIFNHHTYVLASDGDFMEGVQAEAASLAGHLRLGKLVVVYDSNDVTLSGTTSITFTEDVAARYRAYGWHVQQVDDANDLPAIDARDRGGARRSDAAVVDRREERDGVRRAGSRRLVARARESAGPRGGEEDQAQPRLARGARVLHSRPKRWRSSARRSSAAARCRTRGTAASRATRAFPELAARDRRAARAASFRRAGTRIFRSSPPTRRGWRRARRRRP